MKKIIATAAAALMATAAYAADPKTDTSSKDTSSFKDTSPSKDTYQLGSTDTSQTNDTGKVTAKDQAAIKDVVNGLAKAFNNADPKAAAAFFAQDAVLIDPMGNKAVGRDDAEQLLGQNLNGFLKDSNTTFTNIEVKMVKPDVAYLDMDHQVTKTKAVEGQAGKAPPRIHVTSLLVKQGGKWLIEEARPATYVEEQPTPAT